VGFLYDRGWKERALQTPIDALRERVLRQFGLRVEPEMGDYLARRLGEGAARLPSALRLTLEESSPKSSDGGMISVMGGDARTGVPLQMLVDPGSLLSENSKLS
jgi:hypothetical protein